MSKVAAVAIAIALATGCAGRVDYAGKVNYFPPVAPSATTQNSIVVEKEKEDVWKQFVLALGKHSFVINALDNASGIINIGYIGDPEKYVDCGRIFSHVRDERGERTYDFPAARAYQYYEQLASGGLFLLDRQMSLEGRMNIAVERLAPSRTRISATTRYVLTRTVTVRDGPAQSRIVDTIAFDSGQIGRFDPKPGSAALICESNGAFERDVLSLLAGP